jgi:hypothetical protein
MASRQEPIEAEILAQFTAIEKQLAKTPCLSLKEVGDLLGKKGSVIAQYAKAGLIHPMQQGSKKVITMTEVYMMEVYMYVVKNYGCSYTACKIIGALLKKLDLKPSEYMEFLKNLEKPLIDEKEKEKYVFSYENRGTYQKKKAKESRENISRSTQCSQEN